VTPIRVLIAAMPRMLVEIVTTILAHDAEIDIVGEVRDGDGLLQAAVNAHADVIVLSETKEPERVDSGNYHELLYGLPRLKILAIAAGSRQGFLHELQPRVILLGELSPTVLLNTVRAAGGRMASPSASQ
jgi:DNA-binding NarL/FixJ family response regulator